jgi:hypothetical protein
MILIGNVTLISGELKFVADVMLQLSDSNTRVSISENLFRLSLLLDDIGTSTRVTLVNGKHIIEKIESRYKT